MKPAFVTKAGGRNARHTPDPEQLKDAKLKVADWQERSRARLGNGHANSLSLPLGSPFPDLRCISPSHRSWWKSSRHMDIRMGRV
jgi:hypothetical protein